MLSMRRIAHALSTSTMALYRHVQDTGMSDGEWMARNEPRFEAIAAIGHYPPLNTPFMHDDSTSTWKSSSISGLRRMPDGFAVMIDETSA